MFDLALSTVLIPLPGGFEIVDSQIKVVPVLDLVCQGAKEDRLVLSSSLIASDDTTRDEMLIDLVSKS